MRERTSADISTMTLLARCEAKDGMETAATIEAEITGRLDPAAFKAAKLTFRAFHASWEGSIAIAICAYHDALARPTEEPQR